MPEPTAAAATQAPVASTAQAQATAQPTAQAQATAPPAPPAPPTSEQPEGQLSLALTSYGNEVPIPWQEIAFAKNYGRFIWDYLVGTTDDAQLSTDNGLASSWEMSADGLGWTFVLKEGIPFHNGEEFIAEDIKFALDQTIIIPGAPASYKNQLLCCIEENGITTVGDHEMQIRMSKPQIFLNWDLTDAQGNLGAPVDKSHYDTVGEDEYARNPVHTGVYQWTDHLKGDFIEMTAWGEHWREGVPLWETVLIKTIPEESTRIAALKAGEIDVINLSRERVSEIEAAGFPVFPRPGQAVIGFYFHQQWEDVPWADVRVRKAMNLAIDRDAMVEFIFAGRGSPGIVYPMPLSSEVYGGWDRWGPKLDPYPYDPDQAKALLEEAGHGNGFDITMHSYPRPDAPEGPRMVEAMAGYFQAIGINVEIQPIDSATSIAQRLAFELSNTMTFLDAPNRPFPGFAGLMYGLEHSEGQGRSTEDPDFDAVIEAMQETLDPVEAERRFLGIYNYIYDQYIHLPVANLDVSYAGNDRIHSDWNRSWRSWEPNYLDLVRRRLKPPVAQYPVSNTRLGNAAPASGRLTHTEAGRYRGDSAAVHSAADATIHHRPGSAFNDCVRGCTVDWRPFVPAYRRAEYRGAAVGNPPRPGAGPQHRRPVRAIRRQLHTRRFRTLGQGPDAVQRPGHRPHHAFGQVGRRLHRVHIYYRGAAGRDCRGQEGDDGRLRRQVGRRCWASPSLPSGWG